MDFSFYGFQGFKEVFNTHPAFVHFPIALLPSALFFYVVGLLWKKPAWLLAGRVSLFLALASVIVTVVTGLSAEDSFPHNEHIHEMIHTHRNTGFVITGLTALLAVWSCWHKEQRPRGSGGFLFVMALAGYLVLQNGDIGSRMVYVEGAAVKPAIFVITNASDHPHEHQ